jgi:hypothetical protein
MLCGMTISHGRLAQRLIGASPLQTGRVPAICEKPKKPDENLHGSGFAGYSC